MNELDVSVTDVEVKPTKEHSQFVDPLTRLKMERARKKEVKKAVKATTQKIGNKRLAKILVNQAIKSIEAGKKAGNFA
jgi:hypothetical protein